MSYPIKCWTQRQASPISLNTKPISCCNFQGKFLPTKTWGELRVVTCIIHINVATSWPVLASELHTVDPTQA